MLQTMQGLTPTIIVTVPEEIDLTEAANVYASFKQGKKVLLVIHDGLDVQAHSVGIYLEQAQTLQFNPGEIGLMINWTYANGQRGATNEIPLHVNVNHILEVLE